VKDTANRMKTAFLHSAGLSGEPAARIAGLAARCTAFTHAACHGRKAARIAAQPARARASVRMASELEQLQKYTVIVADTGDIDSIKQYTPTDGTTNPSLIYQAAQMPEYKALVDEAVNYGKSHAGPGASTDDIVEIVRDKLFALFGAEIGKIVPGYVSIEVDARLSFDVEKSVKKAYRLLELAEESGLPRERVLIKLATTWEGCRVAALLEKQGIRCNMTLLFSLVQAVAAAEAGATLISPFVGRILDWYKKALGVNSIPIEEDPGVVSVRQIHEYYKCFGYDTIVMGASFRSKDEVLALAGCDRLTISPKLLKELKDGTGEVVRRLGPPELCSAERVMADEASFRYAMNQDAMATEKLAEGIRGFAKDTESLNAQLAALVTAAEAVHI